MGVLTVVIRPNNARTEVYNLPWHPERGHGYKVIEDVIGATKRGQVKWNPQRKCFTVTRKRTRVLIEGLAEIYGRVHVIQHGGTDRCVAACWDADPDTAWECECACAGDNHGSKQPIGPVVSTSSTVGEVSVRRSEPREWEWPPL